ncbi:MAG: PQQ-dependent sugar dehydrogenase [Burkholderiales bacterium]
MKIKSSLRLAWLVLPLLFAACGSGSDDPAPAPGTNTAPIASITTPLMAATFKAGDTLAFSGTGTDVEDGALASGQLTWWVDLHHDTHTHPLLLETVGANGSVAIPVRGETSDNIFYRFHLRATDSSGQTNEVIRDVLPQKAQITLATAPVGLALTLDGQPIASTPNTLTGVVGIERDLGAAAQNFNGRRYAFASWSDGGAASHTIATPSANTTYTATFTDTGPVTNNAPVVALSGTPANGTTGVQIMLAASATDSDDRVTKVEFFDGATKLGEDLSSPYTLVWTPATTGAHSITARATDNFGLAATSAAVVVIVGAPGGADTQAPIATLTAPAAFATGLAGTLTLSATATDNVAVTGLEIQLDGTQVGAAGTSGVHSVDVDSTAYTSGQHVVRARARDAAGNLSAWVSRTVQFGGSRGVPAGFTRNETWVTGLSNATAFAQAPDGRFFVAQQGGALRVVKAGALLTAPMLNLTVDSNGERGLIGVTLHPNFASNGFVYVYYTTAANGTHNRVSRFTASGDTAGGEQILFDLPGLSSATNHNGGAMHFGVDGKLYVAVGDNANSANAPLLTSVFGKMLRLNDDGTIPADNPYFATQNGQNRAIWAYGLRNPFTFAVQPGTGRIHINDVGQGTWEEVNLGVQGANYGWPASEGPDNVTAGVTGPLFTYKHSAATPVAGSGPGGFFTGFAIAGGAFYPDAAPFPPAYRNSYYFADYVSRFVARYDWVNNAAYAFATVSGEPVDLLSGADGALYLLTRSGITRFSAP